MQCPVLPASAANAMSGVGAGPNGYNWILGTWTCTNSMAPSPLGASQSAPFTATKLKDHSILVHSTSPNGDVMSYYAYKPSTKTWYSPFADSSGYSGYESSQQSGKMIQFSGMFYMASAAPVPIRDTYTMISMNKYYDLSEAKTGGVWKATAKVTCTKA